MTVYRYCGRDFHADEMVLINRLIGDNPNRCRAELSRPICEALHLRYLIYLAQRPVAALGFGAAAWQCAPRDGFIGWDHQQRQRNLHLVINNARFLILPWVQSRNLASMILAQATKMIPGQWQTVYGYRPGLWGFGMVHCPLVQFNRCWPRSWSSATTRCVKGCVINNFNARFRIPIKIIKSVSTGRISAIRVLL